MTIRVPFLDLQAQLRGIDADLVRAATEVIRSTRNIGGPKVEALEAAVAGYTGARHAIGVSSGTDALLASLMALEVGVGDVVITTPYSFFATAGVVARLGAIPAFVDIAPSTYAMSPSRLEAWFERADAPRERVKAIVPVHLFGQCADMPAILDIASRHRVPVVEDAAQAIGARYPSGQRYVQAGTSGAAGCLSFFPSKNLGAVGDGGMVLTNDEGFADTLRRLRNHGEGPEHHHAMIGGNFRLDPIQAAVLLVKLPHLDRWHARRQAHARYYDQHLAVEGLATPHLTHGRECHVFNQYVITVASRRDELRDWLADNGIETRIYYPVPIHEQPCFASLGYTHGDFPCCEHAAAHSLALPVYPELTTAMQDRVIAMIQAFYR